MKLNAQCGAFCRSFLIDHSLFKFDLARVCGVDLECVRIPSVQLHHFVYHSMSGDRSLSHSFLRHRFLSHSFCAIVLFSLVLHDRSSSHSFARSFFIAQFSTIVLYCRIVLYDSSFVFHGLFLAESAFCIARWDC